MKRVTLSMILVVEVIFSSPAFGGAAQPYSPGAGTARQGAQPGVSQNAPAHDSPAQPLRRDNTTSTTAAQKSEEGKVVFQSSSPAQWVSWGYLRAYQPQTLGRILEGAKAGQLPAAAIAGVVHPSQMQTLMNNVKVPTEPASAKRSSSAVAAATKSSGAVSKLNAASTYSSSVMRFLPVTATPNRIDFGAVMLGQSHLRTVRFMAPVTGEAQVNIADSAFRILRVRSLNGTFQMQTSQVTLPGGQTLQNVRAVPNVSQTRTAPPWTLPVKSGEDVEVLLALSRSRDVSMGEHNAQLGIRLSTGNEAAVPVHARIDGTLFGIDINVDGEFRALPGRDFLLPFEWINNGEPGEATATLENLPPGFTTATPVQTVKLGKGERRRGAFVINVSNALTRNDYVPYVLPLKLANGPLRATYAIDVMVYPPWLMKSVRGTSRFSDGDSIEIYGMMQIRNDGWFQFEGKITSSSLNSAFIATHVYRYDVGIALPGGFNHAVHGTFGHGTCFGCASKPNDSWSESGNDPRLAGNFLDAARGLQAAVMNPYIKVVRSAF